MNRKNKRSCTHWKLIITLYIIPICTRLVFLRIINSFADNLNIKGKVFFYTQCRSTTASFHGQCVICIGEQYVVLQEKEGTSKVKAPDYCVSN